MNDGPSSLDDLKKFIFILAIIIAIWFYTGGYKRPTSSGGPYLLPATYVGDSPKPYGDSRNSNFNVTIGSPDTEQGGITIGLSNENSTYSNTVSIENYYGAYASDPNQEYITIKANNQNKTSVNISDWKLVSGTLGTTYKIGAGIKIFYSGKINSKEAIVLAPGEKAIISTGRSPVGYSFKLNRCSGYLEQFQTFYPNLNTYSCPDPKRDYDIPFDAHNFNDRCLDYIDNLPTCRTLTTTIPVYINNVCNEYITKHFNYNGCVDDFKFKSDFFIGEWRVYLERDNEIWKSKRETIKLIDNQGKLVHSISY